MPACPTAWRPSRANCGQAGELRYRHVENTTSGAKKEIVDMEQKGQYTAGEPLNSKPSAQAGGNDTTETSSADAKADALAILVSALAEARRAGVHIELRQDNQKCAAYIVIPGMYWNHENGLHLTGCL